MILLPFFYSGYVSFRSDNLVKKAKMNQTVI